MCVVSYTGKSHTGNSSVSEPRTQNVNVSESHSGNVYVSESHNVSEPTVSLCV